MKYATGVCLAWCFVWSVGGMFSVLTAGNDQAMDSEKRICGVAGFYTTPRKITTYCQKRMFGIAEACDKTEPKKVRELLHTYAFVHCFFGREDNEFAFNWCASARPVVPEFHLSKCAQKVALQMSGSSKTREKEVSVFSKVGLNACFSGFSWPDKLLRRVAPAYLRYQLVSVCEDIMWRQLFHGLSQKMSVVERKEHLDQVKERYQQQRREYMKSILRQESLDCEFYLNVMRLVGGGAYSDFCMRHFQSELRQVVREGYVARRKEGRLWGHDEQPHITLRELAPKQEHRTQQTLFSKKPFFGDHACAQISFTDVVFE